MMKTTFSILIALLYIAGYSYSQSAWTKRTGFPELRYRAAAFSIVNKGYVGTGSTPTRRMNDFWQYDPSTDTWQQRDSLPAPARESAVGFSINGIGYIGGGVTDTFALHHDFWDYNPQTDEWTQRADIPISLSFPGALVAFSINGKGYVQASFNTDNFWQYDPTTDSWTKKASFPGGDLMGHVAFSIGSNGYIGTGFETYSNTPNLWQYSPVDDQWTKKADFPGSARNDAVGFSIGSKGYIGLGNGGGTLPRDFWAYDTASNSWTQIDSCGYGDQGAFAFTVGSKAYVGTGAFANLGEFWEYDPTITSLGNVAASPTKNFILSQNYPNPFNPSTTIEYSVSKATNVTLALYDCLGRKLFDIENRFQSPGQHTVRLNLDFLPSGIYFYKLNAQSSSTTKKLVLLK